MMVADFKCIIELNDNEGELHAYKQKRPHGLKQRDKTKHKVELVDQYRLILTTEAKLLSNRTKSMSRHFRFDHIDYASKNMIKHKVFKLIDDALTQKEPSCLIRFSTLRECPIGLMTHLLVTKVEKRVRDLNMHILAISIEQYNIEKYNAESLLSVTYNNMPRIYLPTTLALLNWLQGDYYRLWQAGGGHDCMDFEFHLADLENSKRIVKFSFLQFYFEIMDRDTYDSLNSYFLNMGTKKKTKNSMITSCLKNYFGSPVPWTVWLLFDVLVENNGTCYAEDLLDFANVVATTLAVCKVDPKKNEMKKKKKTTELSEPTSTVSIMNKNTSKASQNVSEDNVPSVDLESILDDNSKNLMQIESNNKNKKKKNKAEPKEELSTSNNDKDTVSKSVQHMPEDNLPIISSITILRDNKNFNETESLILIPELQGSQITEAFNATSLTMESNQSISKDANLFEPFKSVKQDAEILKAEKLDEKVGDNQIVDKKLVTEKKAL